MIGSERYNKLSIPGSVLAVIVLLLLTIPSTGQFYNGSQLEFGKNRVQYRDFIWTYYMFDDFDIYFYRDGQKLAEYTARYASKQIRKTETKLESNIDEKIQFIVFNDLTDLKQSNIGLSYNEEYNTGGVTKIIGKKVILYFNGQYDEFEKQIRAGIANVVVNQLLYGGSIGSQIKNSTLFILPDWYIQGLISYLSESWNTEIDNHVRDGIQSGAYKKFNHLTGQDAVYGGHSLWNYISQEYGKSAVPNILHMTNISHSIENGFMYVIGISFKTLIKEWLKYYKDIYEKEELEGTLPQGMLLKKVNDNAHYSQLTTSPDGNYAAFVTNELGRYKIWLYDTEKGKKKKIFKAGFRLGENVDYSYPLLSWHPSSKILAFVVERKGFVRLYMYDMETRKSEDRLLINFEKVLDFSYSDDGSKLVMSAARQGQSDIYVFDIASGSYDRITYDIYNDLQPCFIDNSKKIIFSSNRPGDTLEYNNDYYPDEISKNNDLFMYNYSTRSNILKRLTKTELADEKQPMPYKNGYISFLSDENGIYNEFAGMFDSVISRVDTAVHYRYFMDYFPVTNYSRNIQEHSINSFADKHSMIVYSNEAYRMYVKELDPVEELYPVDLENTKYMQRLVTIAEKEKSIIEKETHTKEIKKEKPRKRFRNVRKGEIQEEQKIDIDNYRFDKQSFLKITGDKKKAIELDPDMILDKKEDDFKLPKRRNYYVEYSFNELTTQVDFNFLNATYQPFTGGGPIYMNPGFNALMKVGLSDLLEDHRLIGGVRLNVNLINNEYLFSYANLEKRLDKEIIFHRQTLEGIGNYSIIRYHTNELFYVLSWPFNEAMSLKGTFIYRNNTTVFLSTDEYNLKEPNRYENWMGIKGDFTYDDTRNVGLNLYYGTRYKIFGEYYQLVDENSQNLIVLGLDFRNYQKIHRTFIWANRFAASTSFGNNRLIYYMGGVDNWLFPKFNNETPIDYEENYHYQTLATNMRGFKQNIRNGNSFFLINSELRFPVFRYFFNRPIKSDFLNNFQIVAFGDVGTAWTGWNPYSQSNSLFTNTIDDGPLHITVEVQKEPVVAGFGVGLRTRVLGYFLRADWAWGLEDWVFNPGVFHISLSLDF